MELISGNIGIGLVFIVVVKGYKFIFIMFVLMSLEWCILLRVFGVEFIFIDLVKGMKGVV